MNRNFYLEESLKLKEEKEANNLLEVSISLTIGIISISLIVINSFTNIINNYSIINLLK